MADSSLLGREVDDLITNALREDLPEGDITTDTLIPESAQAQAVILAKASGILAGACIVQRVFYHVDRSVLVTILVQDGTGVDHGATVIRLKGAARSILTGERVALNFLQHLSGIASLTAQFCRAVQGFPVMLLDTRKTTPGLRRLEKWAVTVGGGTNHRMSLSDGILVKDNHLALLRGLGTDVAQACRQAKSRGPHGIQVCVEVESLEQIQPALEGQADVILLDNMSVEHVREAVRIINSQALTEVSGGVHLGNVRDIAATGVDRISIGSLTHSAPAMDFSLQVEPLSSPC